MSDPTFKTVQDALDRMRRAAKRGTGCQLTAEMIQSLGVSIFAEIWSEPRPDRPGYDISEFRPRPTPPVRTEGEG